MQYNVVGSFTIKTQLWRSNRSSPLKRNLDLILGLPVKSSFDVCNFVNRLLKEISPLDWDIVSIVDSA